MSEPEKAISEICRVLKQDGILIALTFTAEGSAFGRLKIRFIEFGGFKIFHKWTPESYLEFLHESGFTITKSEIFRGGLMLTYVEAKK